MGNQELERQPLVVLPDTRHTTASLLMMFGTNPAAVQRILATRTSE
jgi:hypothetical protein